MTSQLQVYKTFYAEKNKKNIKNRLIPDIRNIFWLKKESKEQK